MLQIYKIFTYMHNCNILNKNVCCRSFSNAWMSAFNVVKTKQINSSEHSRNDLLKRTRGPTFTLWRVGDQYFRGSQVPLLHLWGGIPASWSHYYTMPWSPKWFLCKAFSSTQLFPFSKLCNTKADFHITVVIV